MKQERVLRIVVIGLALLAIVLLVSGLTGAARGELPASSNAASGSGVGYVNMDDLQKTLPDFIDLQKFIDGANQEMLTFNQYLTAQAKNAMQALDDERNKAKTGKSAEEQKNIDAQYDDLKRKKMEEFQKQAEQKRTELGNKVNEQTKATMNKVKKIIEQVAKAENIGLVLDERVLFYGGVDLTQKVINAVNKTGGKNSASSK